MSDDDLRALDGHESWRGVCRTLGVDPDQHEPESGDEDVHEVFV